MDEGKTDRPRRQLQDWEQRLGLQRGEGIVYSQEAILAESQRLVDTPAQELLGILSAYRRTGSVDYHRVVHDSNSDFHGLVSEWIHLPRSLSDGSHVVIEFRSNPQKEKSSRLFGRKKPPIEDTPPIPARDGVFLCRVTVIPAHEITSALIQKRLDQAPLNYAPEDYPNLFGRVWAIELGQEDKPSLSSTGFKTLLEPLPYPRVTPRMSYPQRLQIQALRFRPKERELYSVDLATGAMSVRVAGWTNVNPSFKRYGLDGETLVEAGKAKDVGVGYVDFVGKQMAEMQRTLQATGS